MREACYVRDLLQLFGAYACALGGADQRSHTGSGHEVNGNFGIFEHLQDTDVYQAASKTSAKSDAQFQAARLRYVELRVGRNRRARELARERADRTSEAT